MINVFLAGNDPSVDVDTLEAPIDYAFLSMLTMTLPLARLLICRS
jgi:hypothetical protein